MFVLIINQFVTIWSVPFFSFAAKTEKNHKNQKSESKHKREISFFFLVNSFSVCANFAVLNFAKICECLGILTSLSQAQLLLIASEFNVLMFNDAGL